MKRYTGAGITVTVDPARCLHAAECLRGVPAVFDAKRRPWISPDAAAARRCPSGALPCRCGQTATGPFCDGSGPCTDRHETDDPVYRRL